MKNGWLHILRNGALVTLGFWVLLGSLAFLVKGENVSSTFVVLMTLAVSVGFTLTMIAGVALLTACQIRTESKKGGGEK